ncbi:hypothetical protein EIMP300_36190 [Escherichia coli]|uniref:Uncharacterized protein n=1 Tax=Escherichia coli TaxID=562 RepID=A0A8S0FRC0_ECOLX|nr:hypothetical protein EIMP300_36190 [Escherichia coli]
MSEFQTFKHVNKFLVLTLIGSKIGSRPFRLTPFATRSLRHNNSVLLAGTNMGYT